MSVPETAWVASNQHAFAIRDRFPVSPGHTLVITRRVIPDWFAATEPERLAILRLVDEVKAQLDASTPKPDGYNVGFNAGTAAGQTVAHLHVHVIPRYRGDMDDPRGGVRHVIPSKGNYLRTVAPLATGGQHDPFARHLLPLFDTATDIAIVAAFVQESGVARIAPALERAIARGARVRLVTGDYLQITQAVALDLLLDVGRTRPTAPADSDCDDDPTATGTLETRVVETASMPGHTRSFHPKSWRFESPTYGIAYVGSSNLSRAALDTGVEWNLRVDRDRDAEAYARVCTAFDALWQSARPLDDEWIAAYEARARQAALTLPAGEVEPEPLTDLDPPHQVQTEALAALRTAREQGRQRALVVLATGLGKTLLAVHDLAQLWNLFDTPRPPRLLFLAHRHELLRQAARDYRRLVRTRIGTHARVGWFIGDTAELGAELVFASVPKLARREHLDRLRAERFDYVVVDEVHHAAADSYRRILGALQPPCFLLGLTATPDRADGADILGLFDDFVAYRAGIARGVEIRRLVPFHYFGVKDDIDYDNIPWRNRRFDPDALATAAQTTARMETLWRAWNEHRGTRTLVFCCSIAHATFARQWLRDRGVRVRAVFTGQGSDDRETALASLAAGDIDALCAVDVFNEGVDVPAIDRVVMLRPTESSVVFLQQLGRGLRASEATNKKSVTVIDFVGNHNVFLERVRTLLSLAGPAFSLSLKGVLASPYPAELPDGCSVDLELEAKQMLARLFRGGGADEIERAYRELRDERDERPTAGELRRMGYNVATLRDRHQSWFRFVHREGDLDERQQRVLDVAASFLRELEVTHMDKSFKMITLQALLDAGLLADGMPIRDLALASHAILHRSPVLLDDLPDDERPPPSDPQRERAWIAYWKKNPIRAWTTDKRNARTWFRVDADRFVLDMRIDADLAPALTDMVRELVDLRLAEYRARRAQTSASPDGFVCKVLRNQRDPILKLPDRDRDALPRGETDVRLPDGSVWQFSFQKIACNVARPAGVRDNRLPDLLRRWFGPRAGMPGTAFQVRFHASPDGLWIEPAQGSVVELEPRRGVPAYPDLRAAAGHAQGAVDTLEAERVWLPLDADDDDLFAVRVTGTSMDGGKDPLRDGDWAVMRLSRAASGPALDNRVVLTRVDAEPFGSQYQIKRLKRAEDGGWLLTSDNPDGPTLRGTDDITVIAKLERIARPEDLAPPPGTVIDDDDLAARFALETLPPSTGRHSGHLFLFIDRKGLLIAPDRVRDPSIPRRPGETAYVLAKRPEGGWRYIGVARWHDDDDAWAISDVDYATWRTWGEGRDVSRRLPEHALAKARLAIDAVLALPEPQRRIEQPDGKTARVLGPAQKGGLRIDGGEAGFKERTVSLTDIAWVAAADEDVDSNGGTLDEELVNRLRYLEGTPKGSTRWIDTGWALAAWRTGKPLVREPLQGAEGTLHRVHADDGTPLDATFRVERVGDALTIVIESRGGTRGSKEERNTDYMKGLGLILVRLKQQVIDIQDVVVDSSATSQFSHEERRLKIEGQPYPIRIDEVPTLLKKLTAAAARAGRAAGARGAGNPTKRLRIFVAAQVSPEALSRTMAR